MIVLGFYGHRASSNQSSDLTNNVKRLQLPWMSYGEVHSLLKRLVGHVSTKGTVGSPRNDSQKASNRSPSAAHRGTTYIVAPVPLGKLHHGRVIQARAVAPHELRGG